MRCEFCDGIGLINTIIRELPDVIPRHECGGTGIQHCCDGLREQIEPDRAHKKRERSKQRAKELIFPANREGSDEAISCPRNAVRVANEEPAQPQTERREEPQDSGNG